MNVVTFTGRLVEDIQLNHLDDGKEVANGTIAVQRNFKNKEGKYDADFIDFTIWGKRSTILTEYAKKGDKIGLVGEWRTRIREKDGVKFKESKLNVNDFDLPERPKESKPNESKGVDKSPLSDEGQPIDLSDDDLPF